jgi:hypothetical protein
MTAFENLPEDLAIIGERTMDIESSTMPTPRPRFGVRYSDPVAWAATALIGEALAQIEDAPVGDRVGVIYVSEIGPIETAAELAHAAAMGEVSPLRFPAALPVAIVGTVCIAHALRGPTLTITSPPHEALSAAVIVSAAWLRRDVADAVALIMHERLGAQVGMAVVVIVRNR